MWTSLLRLIAPGKTAWVPYALCVLCLLCALFLAYQANTQALRLTAAHAELSAQQSAHNATRAALTQAQADIAALHAALAASENATAAVQRSLGAALSREAQALRDSAARKQILDAMRTRTRTTAETLEVIDHDTRRAVADRLNRPL